MSPLKWKMSAKNRAVEKGGGREGGTPAPYHFLEQKCFFHVKSKNIKFS